MKEQQAIANITSKAYGQELRKAAREEARGAVETLVTISKTSKDEHARVAAAVAILDLACGKPKQRVVKVNGSLL
jgi:hypothetical protein